MAYTDSHQHYNIYLSPSLRGAEDTLSEPLLAFLGKSRFIHLCSQQVADKEVVSELASLKREREGRAKVLIEDDYLYEHSPVAADAIWELSGKREKNRQCLLAMLRGGVQVRADQIKGALQHTNLILSENADGECFIFATSANLSRGSIGTHFNWAITLNNPSLYSSAKTLFKKSWDGDFRDASLTHQFALEDEELFCGAGADGQAAMLAEVAINKAQKRICFAYFNLSSGSRVQKAIFRAAERGVEVYGVVDGDQAGTSWDAVPDLRKSGVDVKYYPGVLTGSIGRMHYKMFAVDGFCTHLSTANASHAAEDSFEFALTIESQLDQNSSHYIQTEIDRLMLNARIT